jgi:drug/metabolite transporter (DMT)-like permease
MSGPLMAAIAVPALAIAFWRNALASLAVAPVAMLRHRHELQRLSLRGTLLTLLAGLLLAGHFALWVTALKLTSVASATALVSLQAGFVVAFSRLTGARVTRRVVLGLLLAIVGVLVVSGVDLTVSGRALGGDGLAFAGGALAAVYVMLGGEVRRTVSTTAYTQVCYASCAAVLLLACLLGNQPLWGYDGYDWWRLLALTLAAQLLGHSVFNHLLATISPTVVSLSLLLEVPGAALLAALFLRQSPPIGVYLGLGLILAGLTIVVSQGPDQPAGLAVD